MITRREGLAIEGCGASLTATRSAFGVGVTCRKVLQPAPPQPTMAVRARSSPVPRRHVSGTGAASEGPEIKRSSRTFSVVESSISPGGLPVAMPSAPVPSRADVVILGGGCMGTSTAFHLARRGLSTILLEKGHVASGATGHSGAIVRQHYECRIGVHLARASLQFFRRFEEETGVSCDFRTTGFLSGTRARDESAFDRLFDLLVSEGVRAERLSPGETKALEPQLDVSDCTAFLYDPDAGYADPISTAAGFAFGAERQGATVLEGTEARDVLTREGHVVGVRVRGGATISTDRVLVAAGNWTPALLRSHGVRLPIRFLLGHVLVLRRPEGFGAPPKIHFDFYHNTYSRPGGEKELLVGYMDTDPTKALRRHTLADASIESTDVRDLQRRLAKRFPVMARAQFHGGWLGVYDVTPDAFPILDRVGPEGLYTAVGFSGHGFKLSPEVGRLLAEYMATDRPPEALRPLRASRFREGHPVTQETPFPAKRGPRLP